MADGESVRVAVRVRPFNGREKERNAGLCVRMSGKSTTLINPENKQEKTFTFDYSYWSHDGETTRDDGYNESAGEGQGTDGATYADQMSVYNDLGQGVLNNAYEGFNSCLFAYGQTGAGKSYSMVGYGTNKGIVPIACDEIFKKIEDIKSGPDADKNQFQVTIQMLEIYNEQVRDLFSKTNPSGGLKVRMNPKTGVEVVGLTEWPVGSYKEIDERIETATKNRTVAATQMNATSSRAHTVVTICYTQLELNAKGPGKHSEKKAKMNLVDLAGSERAESTGATGDRLKEGAAINLSLTMLGNVITALAEKSNNPKKNVLVPYRESKLTCILQDALGGNAKTIMICALSPADINFEETLGTLRYADRAKQIKNKPKVNVDPTEALIQQLKAENERLKAQVGGVGGVPTVNPGLSDEDKEAMKKQLEEEMQAKVLENQRLLDEMNKSWEQKLQEAQAMVATQSDGSSDGGTGISEAKRRETEAHILNIHEDLMLSKAICYFFPPGKSTVFGNRSSPGKEDILLGGLSIRPEHCSVTNTEGSLSLSVRDECKVLLNGIEVKGAVDLHHNDRLSIGTNYFFVVVNPQERDRDTPEGGWKEVDWDMLNREIAKAQGLNVDLNWGALSEDERRKALLNDELVQVMPRVTEANDISAELKRGVKFETKITPVMTKAQGMVSMVMVRVEDTQRKIEWLWDKSKFINRVYLMREMYEKFENGELSGQSLNGESDPFWDPNEPVNIGYCAVHLKPLAYCLSVEDDYALYREASQDGLLRVKVEPCRPDGSTILDTDDSPSPYDDVEDDPKALIGKRYDVLVTVVYARGISKKYDKEVFVKFEMPQAVNKEREDGAFQTPVQYDTTNPQFNFKQQITWPSVNEDLIHSFQNGTAILQVWGLQEDVSGQSSPQKKIFTVAEGEALQHECSKLQDENAKLVAALADVQVRAIHGAHVGVMSGLLLELADAMQAVGVDVAPLKEYVSSIPPPPADSAVAAEGLQEQIQTLNSELEKAHAQESMLQKDLVEAKDVIDKKAEEVAATRIRVAELEAALAAHEVNSKANSSEDKETEIERLNSRLKQLEGERSEMEQVITTLRETASAAAAESTKLKQDLDSIKTDLKEEKGNSERLQMENSALQKTISDLKAIESKAADQQNQTADSEAKSKQLALLEKEVSECSARLKSKDLELEKKEKEIEEVRSVAGAREKELQEQRSAAGAREKEFNEDKKKADGEVQEAKTKCAELQQRLKESESQLEAKREELRQLSAATPGKPSGSKACVIQ